MENDLHPPRWARWLLWAILAAAVAAVLLMAAVPPVSRDALTHHLAVPKLYLQGGIRELPDIVFSYYPELLDLLYMLPLAAGWDTGAKYLHFSFALGTALLIFLFVRRRLGPAWGLLGALFFLTLPVVVKLSVTVYVDLGLIFFSTAALFAMVLWLESGKRRWLLASALACGLALSTKYNGLIVFTLLALLGPLFHLRSRRREEPETGKAVAGGALFVLVALLVFSPWMARNWVWKQNPVYPLFPGFFQVEGASAPRSDVPKEEESAPRVGPHAHFLLRSLMYGESPLDIAMIPLRIFYDGRDDDPQHFDGRLNPLLLLLPLVLLVFRRENGRFQPETGLFAWFSLLFILLVFFQIDMRIRWIAPAIPPLVVLSVYGLHRLGKRVEERFPGKGALLVGLLALAWLAPDAKYMADLFYKIDPIPYLTGEVSKDRYIGSRVAEYPLVKRINRRFGSRERILALFLGNRRYYFDVPVTTDSGRLVRALEKRDAPDCLGVPEEGYTLVMIRNDLFMHWAGNLPDEQKVRLNAFLARCIAPLDAGNGYSLYRVLNPLRQQVTKKDTR